MRTDYRCSVRGDDRASAPRLVDGRWVRTPPVLRRRTIRLVTFLSLLFLVYAALMPFGTRAVASSAVWAHAAAGGFIWRAALRADIWANVAVYVPIGLLLRLMLRRRPARPVREIVTTCICAAALSGGIEYLQIGRLGRAADVNDLLANSAGAAVGALLAPFFQNLLRFAHGLITVAFVRRRRLAPSWLLFLAGTAFLALGMAPFYAHKPVSAPVGYTWLPLHSDFPRAWLDWLIDGIIALVPFACGTFLLAAAVARRRGRASIPAVAAAALSACIVGQAAYWHATGHWADSIALVLVIATAVVAARAYNAISPDPTPAAR